MRTLQLALFSTSQTDVRKTKRETSFLTLLYPEDAHMYHVSTVPECTLPTIASLSLGGGNCSARNHVCLISRAVGNYKFQIPQCGSSTTKHRACSTTAEKMSHVVKKRKLDKSRQDRLYFDSYTDVTIHEEMIADHVRTNTYRMAIMRNSDSIRGKVVLDVGAGTGVLSIFCAQAGAKKVYAVEACSIAEQAVKIVKQNNMEDKIEVIRGTVETVDLPEKVEVIVSEWMGYALLHESMLNSVLYARDKWLQPGGIILPSKAELYIAPISDPVVEDRLHFWYTVKDQYGVDMSCMSDFATRCIMNSDITVNSVTVEDVLSHPARFAELDLHSVTVEELLRSVKGKFRCESFGSAAVNAFCVYFTVTFPCPDKPLVLSTSPFKTETHWKQAVLYLDAPVDVVQDTVVTGEVSMYPSEESARHICIHVDYTIGEHKRQSRTFSIPDWSSEAQP